MKNKYPLSSSTWDDKEIKAINKVIDNDQYTMGKHVGLFENAFSKYIGSKFSVMVNSGSSANLLAIASLFWIFFTLDCFHLFIYCIKYVC